MGKRFVFPKGEGIITIFPKMTNITVLGSIIMVLAVFNMDDGIILPWFVPAQMFIFVICLLTQHSNICRIIYLLHALAIVCFGLFMVYVTFTQHVPLLAIIFTFVYGVSMLFSGIHNFKKHKASF